MLKLAGVLVVFFLVGIFLTTGYLWYRGSLGSAPFFVTAAGNMAPSGNEAPVSNVLVPSNPVRLDLAFTSRRGMRAEKKRAWR